MMSAAVPWITVLTARRSPRRRVLGLPEPDGELRVFVDADGFAVAAHAPTELRRERAEVDGVDPARRAIAVETRGTRAER